MKGVSNVYIGTIIASVIGYFLGSFSFSITVVKIKAKQDVREVGSKNAGATNASRILGKKWGVLIMLLDSLKIMATAFIAIAFTLIDNDLFNKTSFIIPALFTLIGHCYPIYYKFKGGKAVSCFLGIMMITNWVLCIGFVLVWIILILLFQRVSISSIFGAIIIAMLMWIPQVSGGSSFELNGFTFFSEVYEKGYYFVWFNSFHKWSGVAFYDSFLTINIIITLSTVILIVRHSQNIVRLFKHEEPKFFHYKSKDLAKKDNDKKDDKVKKDDKKQENQIKENV
ncbi:glycerol-3-phosphate acyltransferase PlsY [Spiroplasma chinense]|uniref:Glycerol-3-phosphate acyltransferase n=1 Tax=Spiroplasma chinense TaxID=216932 RepID=A0A5B9Y4X3_9MOLU|nr:glycerol-3-phosphate 1-O-acyltransferase PlsY [Spiroplasma chinense]QEH61865.1 glycerol-3-phosphate acyltransferase PlsY [Spiroplasma chinense]